MSEKPVYVPRNSRKRQRFHGAFTGGFSAGYFNTVGSKEGWQPMSATTTTTKSDGSAGAADALEQSASAGRTSRNVNSSATKQQRPEDFMDEHDHNEWGGPMAVHGHFDQADYYDDDDDARKRLPPCASALLMVTSPQNVGRRLLRVLGWRESGSAAYVPDNSAPSAKADTQELADEELVEHKLLSERRLRKIQLNQKRVAIPQPKLDLCGLGYEPFQDAPEFRAHKERRERLAKERAKVSRNVYRISDALGKLKDNDDDDYDDHGAHALRRNANQDDPYVSYETVEDFVGVRSFGGFALQDDEDDAYDDKPTLSKLSGGQLKVDREEFDTDLDVGGTGDNDDEQHHAQTQSSENMNLVGGIFSSWAQSIQTNTKDGQTSSSTGVSTDGRPPLSGFVLGSSTALNNKRYRGPDVPQNYDVKKHGFGPQEHPLVFKALSRAEQLIDAEDKNKVAVEEALKMNLVAPAAPTPLVDRTLQPLAGSTSAFSGISAAMNNRFTSSLTTNSESNEEEKSSETVGGPKSQEASKVTRTFAFFTPEPLLCKRFKVPVPNMNSTGASATAGAGSDRRSKEEAFFHDEILSRLPANATTADKRASNNFLFGGRLQQPAMDQDGLFQVLNKPQERHPGADRPPDQVYKSIFEPSSSSSSSSVNESSSEPEDAQVLRRHTVGRLDAGMKAESLRPGRGSGGDASEASDLDTTDDDDSIKEHRSKKHNKKKDKRKRKRSSNSERLSEDSSSDKGKRSKKQKKRSKDRRDKKRKKKHKKR